MRDRTDADAIDRGRGALADTARWYHGPAKLIGLGQALVEASASSFTPPV